MCKLRDIKPKLTSSSASLLDNTSLTNTSTLFNDVTLVPKRRLQRSSTPCNPCDILIMSKPKRKKILTSTFVEKTKKLTRNRLSFKKLVKPFLSNKNSSISTQIPIEYLDIQNLSEHAMPSFESNQFQSKNRNICYVYGDLKIWLV